MVSVFSLLMTWFISISKRVLETEHALWQHEDARRAQWRELESFSAGVSSSVGWDLHEYFGDKEYDFISTGFLILMEVFEPTSL